MIRSEEDQQLQCPICGGKDFTQYNGRPLAACGSCKSLERGRLQHVVLRALGLPQANGRTLHVAPEPYLYSLLSAASGNLYHPCDFDPGHRNYRRLEGKIYPIDLCRDLVRFPSDLFDLIIHNHVLEHLPCPLVPVLEEHKRVLRPGGYFIFSIPFRTDFTDEDTTFTLSEDERTKRFGQYDHVRIFGKKDFPQLLQKVFGQDLRFPVENYWSRTQLTAWGIPPNLAYGISGVTIFYYQKPSALAS